MSEEPPRRYVACEVVKVLVDFALVHVEPPSHDNWIQRIGLFEVLSAQASSLTSTPLIVEPEGTDKS